MSLKMKLTASISAFFLVVGLMLIGIMAVNQATVNMGGSISFTATDVYARVTGKIENAQGEYANKELPTLEFSAENDTPDQSGWSNLNLLFDDDATPIVIKVTVENLSAQNTLRVNLNDTLSSTVGNLEKVVKNDGEDYTNQTDITLQPNGQENDSTTFTITMSVIDKNTSLTADFDYELNLEDQYYVETYEYFTFEENGDGTVELTAFNEGLAPSTDIVIPSTVSQNESGQWMEGNDYTVTAIGNYAFASSINLTSITLPSSLEIIDEGVFSCCDGLIKVDPRNCTNLKEIGAYAFEDCSGLTSITLPSSVTSIGEYAFYRCSGLTNIIIPSSVTRIETQVFDGCSALVSIIFPSGLKSIGNNAFDNCSGFESVDLSNLTSLTSIEFEAFSNCSGLTSISLPLSLTNIGTNAFANCSSLETIEVDAKNSIYHSKDNCLIETSTNTLILGCKSSIIPNNITSVGEYAFYGCSGFESVDLSNLTSLTSIGNSAFYNCTGLTSISLPLSLTNIERYAFEKCSSLETIEVDEGNSVYHSESNCLIESATNTLILGCKNSIIPNNITKIGEYAFSGCSGLTSLDLSNCTNLTNIERYAFFRCSGLTSITLSSSLTSIGSSAFSGCSGIESITLPSSLTSIGGNAFYYCSGLTSVTINQYIFENATSTSTCGNLLSNLTSSETVLVPANLIDDLHLTNSYLDDESEFTRSETANEDGYYVYTKI